MSSERASVALLPLFPALPSFFLTFCSAVHPQLVDLFLSMDFEAYCSEEGRRDKYPHLRPHIVLQWLEKYAPTRVRGRRQLRAFFRPPSSHAAPTLPPD